MKKYIILFILFIIFSYSKVFCVDGQKKGFIIGGGLGIGLLINTSAVISTPYNTEYKEVFLTDFKIGYAPSNTLQIFFSNKVSWLGVNDIIGLYSIGLSQYLSEAETGLFISASFGVGLSLLNAPLLKNIDSSIGFGVYGGVGYEFSKHSNIEVDFLYSSFTEKNPKREMDSICIRLSLNILAY